MKNYFKPYLLLTLCLFSLGGCSSEALKKSTDATLFIKSKEMSLDFTRAELLSRKDRVVIEVKEDPGYPGKQMTYTAVPFYALLGKVKLPKDGTILFHSLDGYSAPLPQDKLLNQSTKGPIAYVAIEPSEHTWPSLGSASGSKDTAGPFYLIWALPGGYKVDSGEWPYQLAGFEIKKPLNVEYPRIFPARDLKATHQVSRGFQVFVKNCFSCHALNHQGDSNTGPDLNVPRNPVEYFKTRSILKAFIRNPQSVRHFPGDKMKPFPVEQISETELSDLVSYLDHMSHRKALDSN